MKHPLEKNSLRRELSNEDYCHYSSPMAKDSSQNWMISGSNLTASENYRNMTNFLNIVPRKINQFMPCDHDSSMPNSSSYKLPLSSSFYSWNPDPADPEKLLDSNQNYCGSKLSSLKRGSSSFSTYNLENLSHSDVLNDTQQPVGCKRKISFDWEPSAPFQPSFFITQRLLASRSLYDPVRDSIEQTSSSGDGPPKSSYSGLGTSVLGAKLHLDGDLVPKRMLGSECSFSKCSHSDLSFHANAPIKTFPAKDSSDMDIDAMESPGGQCKNRSLLKEEKLNSDHARDCEEVDEKRRDHDSELQKDGSGNKNEVKEERSGQNAESILDLKADGCTQNSRTLKYFHAALVEFVKELLKPTWHEGVISKDAYKMIVKKTIGKVLDTLEPHQIPSTSESIKQYLSVSETKLAKLIEVSVLN